MNEKWHGVIFKTLGNEILSMLGMAMATKENGFGFQGKC